jgi:hypothetical protein
MRKLMFVALLATLSAPLAAQQKAMKPMADPDKKVTDGGVKAPGWMARLDRANSKVEDLKFAPMAGGYHVTSGPAAIYYNPSDMASGNYSVTATFTQTKAPAHPEAYGLFIAGANLQADNQSYVYYIVRGDGKYMIKHRAGADVHTIQDWTEDASIHKQDAAGKATNQLTVNVAADSVHFMANGTQVHAFPRSGMMSTTDGQAGIRVNHNLDVHIDGFAVKK